MAQGERDPSNHPLRGLLIAQFLGAFNDNAWKQIVVTLAIAAAVANLPADDPAAGTATQKIAVLAQIALVVPLMLVSVPAAVLADRTSKRSLIIGTKVLELVLMFSAMIVLFFNQQGGAASFVVLALMGAQSALFSPAKYGILPEILPHEKLSAGNGTLEMWSNFAIIGGIVAGPILVELTTGRLDFGQFFWLEYAPFMVAGSQPSQFVWLSGLLLTILSAVGLFFSLSIPAVPAARTSGDTLSGFGEAWKAIRVDRILWLAFIGQILFWSIASLIPVAALAYVAAGWPGAAWVQGIPLGALGIGIGIGSMLAGRLSHAKVEYGLLPLGTLGLAIFSISFGVWGPGIWGTVAIMAVLGIFSGFIIVPLNALLQWRSPKESRGTVIALTNIFVFGGMFAGSAVGYVLAAMDISPRGSFVVAAIVLTGAFLWVYSLVPDAFLRFLLFLLAHTIYRVKVLGRQHVPQTGGALLVPNHVSFIDGLLLIASVDRPIRFLVYSTFFDRPLIGYFLRAMKAIPISSSGGPRVILRAFRDAGRYLDEGHLVCIFAEGQITRTGTLQPFQRGLQRVVKGRTAPIIPIYLDRAIGSIFAPVQKRLWPRQFPYPVTVAYGAPLPADTAIPKVRQAVIDLSCEAWMQRREDAKPLHQYLVHRCRRHPWRLLFADPLRERLGGISGLATVIVMARKLREVWQDQQAVGILLPPSVAGAAVNMAASFAGKISVNLNYTAGKSGMHSAAKQANLRTVVTSQKFLEKAKIELPKNVQPIWVEQLVESVTRGEKLSAWLLAAFAPVRTLERLAGADKSPSADDVVTIIFSSGSTGEPKGVELTHFNVASNVEQVTQVFRVLPEDRVMGVLPLFHSFGYLIMWLAANQGLGIVFYVSPLDAPVIGAMVEKYRATVLLATPTFLQLYLRRCTPAQFGSLRLVIAGAEKLPDRLRDAFEDTFGIRPLEGYGVTECSPVIAVSTTDERGPGLFQPGSRRGYVGQPLPGMSVKIVDPETHQPLEPNTEGMLLVRGPNVMKGYLNKPDLTAEVLRDGWYETGDMAEVDEDTFLKITGRLSRFSKIGGEMVPHGKVEEALHQAAGADNQVFAVTAVRDDRKGERLAVLHTLDPNAIPDVLKKLSGMGLPNLFLPRAENFYRVEQLPMLGSGKLDLRETRRLAEERAAENNH